MIAIVRRYSDAVLITALAMQGLTAHYLTRSTVALTAEHDVVATVDEGTATTPRPTLLYKI